MHFFFFFLKNSFRLCQQVSKQFLKLSLQTLFTRKICHEAKHTLQKPAAAMDFFSIFPEANLTASRGPRKQDPLFECAQSKRYSVYSYAQERINLKFIFPHCSHYGGDEWESAQILNSVASRVPPLYPRYNGFYYMPFHKIVSILNTFSIFSDFCNTKHNHLPSS